MKNSIVKKIGIVFLVLLLIASVSSIATYTPNQFAKDIDTDADGMENVKGLGGKIVGLIRVTGTILSVGILIVLGIKYMMGSAEEKAEYKKTLFPYFIGAVLIFAASNLATVIYLWASNL